MAKTNLNIKTFEDMEGALDPNAHERLISDYDGQVPEINQAFLDNRDALQVLRNVAGSPRLTSMTQELVRGLNNSIDATADYFGSVKSWTGGVVEAVKNTLDVSLNQANSDIDKTVLDEIQENFQGGNVGIENFADADTYVQSIQDVIQKLGGGLRNITDDVANANNALPQQVHQSLSQTISTNNQDIEDGYSKISNFLTTNLETFVSQLQNAINDMATAASGKN